MSRKIYYWKLRESELQLGDRTLVMGILNITPDSFSDGGRFLDPDLAYARALELEEQGADIIDIGAESTKPGSRRITADEEWQRLVPVLKRLRGNLTVPLSIDTYKAEIAERALEYGVQIINDPSGLTFDPEIVKVAANGNTGLILSHMRGTPETWVKLPPMQDPAGGVVKDLDATINRARRGGVDKARIVIDPGLGFGKRKEQNSEIIANLRQFVQLDCPILIGPSRKLFLAQETETGTMFATAGAVTAAILYGAHMVRVHDVKEMLPVVRLADEIAAMPDIAARHAEAAAERAAESKALRAARQGSPMHIEEPRPRAMRPPLARPVVVIAPKPVPVEQPETAVANEPEELEAAAAVGHTAESVEMAASQSPVEISGQRVDAPASAVEPVVEKEETQERSAAPSEKVLRPAAAAKPYVRREEGGDRRDARENARDGGREYRPDGREQSGGGERTGWGPPRRRDSESGPPKRFDPSGPRKSFSGDRPSSGPRPYSGGKPFGTGKPYSGAQSFAAGGGDRRDDRPRTGPPRTADGKFAPRRFDDRGGSDRGAPPRRFDGDKPAGRPYPTSRPADRPGDRRDDRDRPSRPPRDGEDRPQRASYGPPRSGPPRSGPPRSGPPRSGPPRSGPPRGGDREGSRPPYRSDRAPAGRAPAGRAPAGRAPVGDRPFRRDGDAPRGDRPPRSDGPSSGRPPSDRPPFGKSASGGKPPYGKPRTGKPSGPPRPFRKRP